MLSAHNKIIPIREEHLGLLYASQLEGVDIGPCKGAERFIGYGPTKYGYGPACILDLGGTEFVAEPHVTWFPWTGNKNKLINFTWAMSYLSQTRQVLIITEKKETSFFDHFVKKGLLRKVGYLTNIPLVEEVHMYQYGGLNE